MLFILLYILGKKEYANCLAKRLTYISKNTIILVTKHKGQNMSLNITTEVMGNDTPNDVILNIINDNRLINKNKWYAGDLNIDGMIITYKGYGTWLQVFEINGFNHSSEMNIKVKEFKEHILQTLNEEL